MTRQYARILTRRAAGLCYRCPAGRLQVNPRTGQVYRLCPACTQRKNAQDRIGPRQESQ